MNLEVPNYFDPAEEIYDLQSDREIWAASAPECVTGGQENNQFVIM